MIIVPILLILLIAIDFIKAMIKGDGKTETNLVVKRLISAVALFLVPYMVNAVMFLLGEFGVNFSDCYNNANQEFILNSSIHEEMSPFAASYTEVTYVDLSNAKKKVVVGGNGKKTTASTGKGMGTLLEYTIEYNVKDDKNRCGKAKCASIATVKYSSGTVKYYMGAQGQPGVSGGESCRINSFMCGVNAVNDGNDSAADLYRYLTERGYIKGSHSLAKRSMDDARTKFNVMDKTKVYYNDLKISDAPDVIRTAFNNGQPVQIFVSGDKCPDLARSHHALFLWGLDQNNKVVFQDSCNKYINGAKKRTIEEMAKCLSPNGVASSYYRMIVFSF